MEVPGDVSEEADRAPEETLDKLFRLLFFPCLLSARQTGERDESFFGGGPVENGHPYDKMKCVWIFCARLQRGVDRFAVFFLVMLPFVAPRGVQRRFARIPWAPRGSFQGVFRRPWDPESVPMAQA